MTDVLDQSNPRASIIAPKLVQSKAESKFSTTFHKAGAVK
jgi:hypothetical protein